MALPHPRSNTPTVLGLGATKALINQKWRQSITALLKIRKVIHHTVAGSGMRDAQCADDGECLAAAMADDGNPVHPKQQCSAVFRVVQPLLDSPEIAAQKG